ncbi:hypothetical protein CB1_000188017 [Camelus ferus]|nr:hypothetical protein CB1_000188017 [Camelus ferus]
MESEMLQSPLLGLGEEDEADLTDWNLPLAFMKKRHCEKIEGSKSLAQSWRMKDRGGRDARCHEARCHEGCLPVLREELRHVAPGPVALNRMPPPCSRRPLALVSEPLHVWTVSRATSPSSRCHGVGDCASSPQMKTVSVALVLCLNVGVDPPDVVKTTPCARLECWIGESGLQHMAVKTSLAGEGIGGGLPAEDGQGSEAEERSQALRERAEGEEGWVLPREEFQGGIVTSCGGS